MPLSNVPQVIKDQNQGSKLISCILKCKIRRMWFLGEGKCCTFFLDGQRLILLSTYSAASVALVAWQLLCNNKSRKITMPGSDKTSNTIAPRFVRTEGSPPRGTTHSTICRVDAAICRGKDGKFVQQIWSCLFDGFATFNEHRFPWGNSFQMAESLWRSQTFLITNPFFFLDWRTVERHVGWEILLSNTGWVEQLFAPPKISYRMQLYNLQHPACGLYALLG